MDGDHTGDRRMILIDEREIFRLVLLPDGVQLGGRVVVLQQRNESQDVDRIGRQVGFLQFGSELRRSTQVQRQRHILSEIVCGVCPADDRDRSRTFLSPQPQRRETCWPPQGRPELQREWERMTTSPGRSRRRSWLRLRSNRVSLTSSVALDCAIAAHVMASPKACEHTDLGDSFQRSLQ